MDPRQERTVAPNLLSEEAEALTGGDLLERIARLHDGSLPVRPWRQSLLVWLTPPVSNGSVRRPLPS